MKQGDLWLIPVNRPHHYILDRKHWNIFWFHLGDTPDWEHLKEQKPRVLTQRYNAKRILEAMEGMIFEGIHRASGWEHNLENYAEILATCIRRILSPSDNPGDRRIRFELGQLWEKVNADIARNWSVKELADELFISEPQLYRYTEKYSKSSPLAMVTRLKMEYASNLLLRTDEPLYLIAGKTGYSTPFAFSKAFKKYSSKSPREFRKSN
jgi:AraC-like DNA-binding protein